MSVLLTMSRKLCTTAICVVLGSMSFACDDKKAETPAPAPQAKTPDKPAEPVKPIIPVATAEDWCREHSMPESICVQCNTSLIAGFKAKNDWCESHSVPESQCLKCHPELKEKFAAAYKAKYGKDAPSADGK